LAQDDWNVDGVGDACDPTLVHFFAADVFATPACFGEGGCTPADFPEDWGVVRTFHYGVPTGLQVDDVLINGTWGGDLWGGSAPVVIYLESFPVAECLEFDPCWDNASTLDWNAGAGFLLSDLGVDFSDPGVQALFDDGMAELSLVQNGEISANFSNLEVTVFVPEPDLVLGLVFGVVLLGVLPRRQRGLELGRRRAGSDPRLE
jgi:hypothetical protein